MTEEQTTTSVDEQVGVEATAPNEAASTETVTEDAAAPATDTAAEPASDADAAEPSIIEDLKEIGEDVAKLGHDIVEEVKQAVE